MTQVVYFNLNADPYLPADGGQTSIPHYYLAFEEEVMGVLVVSTKGVMDLVYVEPQARRKGVARQLIAAARIDFPHLGKDDRLSVDGVALARSLHLPLYGATRRVAKADPATVSRSGQRCLHGAWATWKSHQ